MFQQSPPSLGNQYEDDRVLRSYLARVLPAEMLREIEPSLMELGCLAGGELYQMQLADRLNEPSLTQWDAWGNRIDHVEVTTVWREAERIAVDYGLVATAYEQKHGSLSRVHQCALAYLFTPSTDIYSCPLAMTDGAARTLLGSGNQELIDRAVPHLITRNREKFWTSGQWMTEITGGSDVGLSETIAKTATQEGMSPGQEGGLAPAPIPESQFAWRLYGNKWFASAITSRIALTLARPEGNPPGGRGLALFYIELRDADGRLRNIEINRLKDKLGTRKVPTAELTLAGTPAQLVKGTTDGVRNIAPLLNVTRLWNGISAVALMRRGLALAADYARKRVAFGAPLSEKPLHTDTLAGLEAEAEAAFHLAFYVAELTGRAETGELSENDALLLRLLTPAMKLTTGKQAVMVASEVLEAFGGEGYVEDTGLPQLLRDAQVLPIWEGTTNVLSLDTLRALGSVRTGSVSDRAHDSSNMPAALPASSDAFQAFNAQVDLFLNSARDPRLTEPTRITRSAIDHAENWLSQTSQEPTALEAGARRFAMTLGRTMESALLIRHAQWSQDHEADWRSISAARRFAATGIDLLFAADMEGRGN
ncbi:MAG TPA: acyl-CoA dehydrogenase family protein [Pyrinomonadaceae bacterium]